MGRGGARGPAGSSMCAPPLTSEGWRSASSETAQKASPRTVAASPPAVPRAWAGAPATPSVMILSSDECSVLAMGLCTRPAHTPRPRASVSAPAAPPQRPFCLFDVFFLGPSYHRSRTHRSRDSAAWRTTQRANSMPSTRSRSRGSPASLGCAPKQRRRRRQRPSGAANHGCCTGNSGAGGAAGPSTTHLRVEQRRDDGLEVGREGVDRPVQARPERRSSVNWAGATYQLSGATVFLWLTQPSGRAAA